MLAAQGADLGQWLQHRGRGVTLAGGDDLGLVLLDSGFDLAGLEHRAPLGIDGDDVGADTLADLDQQMAEPAEHQHQQFVAGHDQRNETGLDAGARRAIDQERPLVGGTEHAAVELHGLVHVAGELRIELALQRHRHRAQHARIDVDRAGAHQQARLGIKLGEVLGPRDRHDGWFPGSGRAQTLAPWIGQCCKRLGDDTTQHDRRCPTGPALS